MTILEAYTLALKAETTLYNIVKDTKARIAFESDKERHDALERKLGHAEAAYKIYQEIIGAFTSGRTDKVKGLAEKAEMELLQLFAI